MLDKIEKMLNERFGYPFGYPTGIVYSPCDDNGVDIFDAVEQMFVDKEFPKEEYSIKYETVYTSVGQDITVLSVAFIDWGKLYHETFTVVSC